MTGETNQRVRSGVISLVLASALAATPVILSSTSVAQEPGELPLVAILATSGPGQMNPRIDAFINGMKRLGYFEGQNVHYEIMMSGGDNDLNTPNAVAMLALEPTVVVANGARMMRVIRDLGAEIPIVAPTMSATNREEFELIVGEYAPANFFSNTHISVTQTDRLLLARELVPGLTRIGWLVDTEGREAYKQGIVDEATALGIEVVFADTPTSEDTLASFQSLLDQGLEIIVHPGGSILNAALPDVAAAAQVAGIPVLYGSDSAVANGGLISMGTDNANMFYIASYSVDRLLRGETVTDLIVAEINRPSLIVSLAAAAAIGFTIPETILARATDIAQ